MKSYEFRLILGDLTEVDGVQAEALYGAGCDDATICSSDGVASIMFSRQASSLEEAINSAVAGIASTGLRAVRVEAECPVGVKKGARRRCGARLKQGNRTPLGRITPHSGHSPAAS